MAKFNISTGAGQIDAGQQAAIDKIVRDQPTPPGIDLPSDQVQDQLPEPDPSDPVVASIQARYPAAAAPIAEPAPQEGPTPAVAPEFLPGENAAAEQRESERRAPLSQRISSFDKFKVTDADPFQGQMIRAQSVADVFQYSEDSPSLKAFANRGVREAIAADPTIDPYAESANPVNPVKVLADQQSFDAGVLDTQTGGLTVDPTFTTVATLATEKFFVNQALGKTTETTANVDEMFNQDPAEEVGAQADIPTKAKGITQLGRQIWEEYMREKAARDGVPSDEYLLNRKPPPREELDYVGAMMKEAYSEANPDMVIRAPGPDGQVHFTPTNKGLELMKAADDYAGNPFDFGNEVKPLNQPSPARGQPQFEARTYTREFTTDPVSRARDKNLGVITEARENLGAMGRKADTRGKAITFQNGLAGIDEAINYFESVRGHPFEQPAPEAQTIFADTYQVGREKFESLLGEKRRLRTAAQIAQSKIIEAKNPDQRAYLESVAREAQEAFEAYDAEQVYKGVINKFIESMNTIARYDNQVAYNTFYTIMMNGRLGMQQNKLNPQTDKNVRFVMRVADKPVTVFPADGAHYATKSFKEIATVLFLDGKLDHPQTRLTKFNEQYNGPRMKKLIQLGKELNGLQITPEQATAAGDLLRSIEIRNKDGNNIINMPPGLRQATKPQYSQELQEELAAHDAEERPYIMEFLMDLANYDNAKQTGRPFTTTYEAEMDGITHGVASNGAALGVQETMKRAGALHVGNRKLMVEGKVEGDLRAQLRDTIETRADQMAADMGAGNNIAAFVEMANLAVQDRPNYLKKPPMTFIYGQELKNLKGAVQETMYTGPKAGEIQSIINEKGIDPEKAENFLHGLLVDSLVETLNPRAVRVSRQLRANNVIATITGVPLYYDNTMGFRSYFGKKDVVQDPSRAELEIIGSDGPQSRPVYSYQEELTGGAVRQRGTTKQYGGWGHGQVIPGVVQAYDGNMISKTASGPSFKRMEERAHRRGHVHSWLPVFDAAKTNLANIDLVRDEMNKNWWDGITGTSFVGQIMGPGGWADNAIQQSKQDLKQYKPDDKIRIDQGQYQGLNLLFDNKQLDQLYESVYPVAEKLYSDAKELKKAAKKKAEYFREDVRLKTGIDLTDKAPTELPVMDIRQLQEMLINDLDIVRQNKNISNETERARTEAFKKVRPELITQVDFG